MKQKLATFTTTKRQPIQAKWKEPESIKPFDNAKIIQTCLIHKSFFNKKSQFAKTQQNITTFLFKLNQKHKNDNK